MSRVVTWRGFGGAADVSSFAQPRRAVWLALLGLYLACAGTGCVRPYSARSYEKYNAEELYAVICHDGKRTVRILAKYWPDHRAHGDYRGPCRAIGLPAPTPPEPPNTDISYDDRKARKAWSLEEWEKHQALRQITSDTAALAQ